MRLSACVITKNEEQNIGRCINSYRDIVEEIIVVDTGSTDKTVEIAEELGAQVYPFQWVDDFSKAKNFALSKAKGDWIIFLDADEYFVGSIKKLPNIIRKHGQKNRKIFMCKMFNIDEETKEPLSDFLQSRIFKNTKEISYAGKIHETLSSKNKNIEAVYINENDLAIYHTGYSKNRVMQKAQRNLELLVRELEKPEVDPRTYFFISSSYSTMKDYDNSIYYAKKFLESGAKVEGQDSKIYYNLISDMMYANYDWTEIFKVIDEAIEQFPDHPMPILYLAQGYYYTKQYEKALEAFKKTIQLETEYKGFEINFITGRIHEIEYMIGKLYTYKNEDRIAIDYYCAALEKNTGYLPALSALLDIGRNLEATEMIEILNKIYDKTSFKDMIFLVEELVKHRHKSVLAYYVLWLSNEFKHQDFSLATVFLTNGKLEQAFKHFYEAYLLKYENLYARLAIVAAYLNKEKEMLLKIQDIVKPSFKRIIETMLLPNQENVLFKEDLPAYLDILNEVILIGTDDDIDLLLKFKESFEKGIDRIEDRIGDVLKEKGYYLKAQKHYEEGLKKKRSGSVELRESYFNMGYCYYKSKVFKESVSYFEKAICEGYAGNDVKEFLEWIINQTKDKKILEQAYKLVTELNKL